MQDVRCLQNKPRGKSHRTLASVEERAVAIYQEGADPLVRTVDGTVPPR